MCDPRYFVSDREQLAAKLADILREECEKLTSLK